jgi:hypothetical protein
MDIYRAQKEAENLAATIFYPEKDTKSIYCMVTAPIFAKPVKMVWLDPFLGLIGVAGMEEKGFTRISELDKIGIEIERQWIGEKSEGQDR